MKQIIHINQHNIKHNRKVLSGVLEDTNMLPVITCKTYKDNNYYSSIDLVLKGSDQVIGSIIYQPEKTLSCGANVWVEINTDIIKIEEK